MVHMSLPAKIPYTKYFIKSLDLLSENLSEKHYRFYYIFDGKYESMKFNNFSINTAHNFAFKIHKSSASSPRKSHLKYSMFKKHPQRKTVFHSDWWNLQNIRVPDYSSKMHEQMINLQSFHLSLRTICGVLRALWSFSSLIRL